MNFRDSGVFLKLLKALFGGMLYFECVLPRFCSRDCLEVLFHFVIERQHKRNSGDAAVRHLQSHLRKWLSHKMNKLQLQTYYCITHLQDICYFSQRLPVILSQQ